jgi:hypothetical protein
MYQVDLDVQSEPDYQVDHPVAQNHSCVSSLVKLLLGETRVLFIEHLLSCYLCNSVQGKYITADES